MSIGDESIRVSGLSIFENRIVDSVNVVELFMNLSNTVYDLLLRLSVVVFIVEMDVYLNFRFCPFRHDRAVVVFGPNETFLQHRLKASFSPITETVE